MPIQVSTQEGATLRQVAVDDTNAGGGNVLNNVSLAQALAWVNANVTSLAKAVLALNYLVRILWDLNARVGLLEKEVKRLKQQ